MINLNNYNLSEKLKNNISRFFDEEKTDRKGDKIFCTFAGHLVHQIANILELESCRISYNGYYKDDKNMIILDYAEGDAYLKIFNTEAQYQTELKETEEFYLNN